MLPALLSTAYLGPARYYSKFILHPKIFLEAKESYIKQSFRNRCVILSANGPFSMSIPVKYNNEPKTSIREVRIDYDTTWNKIHWQAIVSAYRNSPFFEYYADELIPFFEKKFGFLFDFNLELTLMILRQTGMEAKIFFAENWEKQPTDKMDYRESIHPKPSKNKPDPFYKDISYTQVFASKFGFVPGMSILDLLFNTGPETMSILEQSINPENI